MAGGGMDVPGRVRLGNVIHTHLPLLSSNIVRYRLKLGSTQAHRATHMPRVHGLAALDGVWLRATEFEISVALWTNGCGKT